MNSNKQRLTVDLDKIAHKKLKHVAVEKEVSISKIVEELILDYLMKFKTDNNVFMK